MNIALVIQARLGSTRFPKKILTDISGKPLLQRLVDRASKWTMGEVVVAVPSRDVAEIAGKLKLPGSVRLYGGPHEDVLARYVGSVDDCDYVIRITGDCPIFDIGNAMMLSRRVMRTHEDYLSIEPERGWPRGADIEIVSWEAMLHASTMASEPYDREHVTPFVRRNEKLKRAYPEMKPDMGNIRLVVDYPEDAKHLNVLWPVAERRHGEFFTIAQALGVIARNDWQS